MSRHEQLHTLEACDDAIEFAEQFDTLQEAWDKCERGDWMLWLAGKMAGKPWSEARKPLVLCLVEVARLVWPHVREQDRVIVQQCYVATEAWAKGIGSQKALRAAYAAAEAAAADVYAYAYAAAYAAAAAAYAAADAAAADAADAAAAYAACAAVDAAAADAAAYAADAAAYAAAYAAYAATRTDTLRSVADIVRKHYPVVPTTKG